ncbi:MAG: hypothetical protein Kow0010_00720 [Dehalococcoidia bacterium]
MLERLRVFVADEDPDSRVATRKALQRAQFEIVGETGYGTPAVSAALEKRPDVLLVAFEEPLARPMDTVEALAGALPDTPILVYSSLETPDAIRRAMVLGARDFLPRPVQPARVAEAVTLALEQEERRQLRRAGQIGTERARGSVIIVAGAKGGIGKSVVTVNLALALRRETGKTVAVIDADTQFGDVATMLDLEPEVTAADLIRKVDTLDRARLPEFVTSHASGVDVLAGPEDDNVWDGCSPEAVARIMDLFAQLYEFVVVDTAGSFDGFLRALVENASLTIVVTSGEVSSVRDTRVALTRMASWGIDPARVRVVLNRAQRASGLRVADLEEAIGHPLFWELPHDGRVTESVQVGIPVVAADGRSPAGREITALALRIAGTRRSLTAEPGNEGRGLWKLTNAISALRGKEHGPDVAVSRASDGRE